MSETSRSHYSGGVLLFSEYAQQALKHTPPGRLVVRAFAGSPFSNYRQSDWRSNSMRTATPGWTDEVPGDSRARGPSRFWQTAAVIGAPCEELEDLKRTLDDSRAVQAVAYLADKVAHVGTSATKDPLFFEWDDGSMIIAMRLGSGPLQAAMGYWQRRERAFTGVEHPRVIEAGIAVGKLATEYNGVLFT